MARQPGKFLFPHDKSGAMAAAVAGFIERWPAGTPTDVRDAYLGDGGDAGTDSLLEFLTPPPFVPFARESQARLMHFLEKVDRCELSFDDHLDRLLVFRVRATTQEHLSSIRNALAEERGLLNELGIEPRDVRLDDDAIRILIPIPTDLIEHA